MSIQQRIEGIRSRIKQIDASKNQAEGSLNESNRRIDEMILGIDELPNLSEERKKTLSKYLNDLKNAKSSAEVTALKENNPVGAWIGELDAKIIAFCDDAERALSKENSTPPTDTF